MIRVMKVKDGKKFSVEVPRGRQTLGFTLDEDQSRELLAKLTEALRTAG